MFPNYSSTPCFQYKFKLTSIEIWTWVSNNSHANNWKQSFVHMKRRIERQSVNHILGNKLQWDFNRNLFTVIQEEMVENVFCKIVANSSRCYQDISLLHVTCMVKVQATAVIYTTAFVISIIREQRKNGCRSDSEFNCLLFNRSVYICVYHLANLMFTFVPSFIYFKLDLASLCQCTQK